MDLTKKNLKKIIIENFNVDINTFSITCIEKDSYNAFSKIEGINATVSKEDDWEKRLITHIKWQLGIK